MKLGENHPSTTSSMAKVALTYRKQGRWEEAEQLEVQVVETRKTKLGMDHPETLKNIANLAAANIRAKQPEFFFIILMHCCNVTFGDILNDTTGSQTLYHPDTLSSMANLASTFWNQGRWSEAEQLQVQVMETRKTKLGADHPDTLSSMANLAFTWQYSGQNAEAINLLRYCLARQKQTLGLNHPQTLANSEALGEWETEGLGTNI
ncbi:hypothetical protein N7476_000316 [Penicillium atrosanguineum]|uniref:Kinesin light chain n=1 Tax=Penicillium atrosanguineum TaxID=1132637 RepID=A0A9W9QEA0_9EURO|nr:hypothetical protein N7476_000316 [Penicillium atrosanguineum]